MLHFIPIGETFLYNSLEYHQQYHKWYHCKYFPECTYDEYLSKRYVKFNSCIPAIENKQNVFKILKKQYYIAQGDTIVCIARKNSQSPGFEEVLDKFNWTKNIIYKDEIGASNKNHPNEPNNLVTYIIKVDYEV